MSGTASKFCYVITWLHLTVASTLYRLQCFTFWFPPLPLDRHGFSFAWKRRIAENVHVLYCLVRNCVPLNLSTSFQLCWISGLVVFWIGSTCPRSPRVSTFTDDTRCYCQTNNGLPAWIRHSLILVGTQSQQNFPDCATSSTALFSLAKKIPWKLWSCCSSLGENVQAMQGLHRGH